MAEPIIYIDRSRVRPGKVEQLKQAIDELVAFIEEREPQLLSYGFYLDEDDSRMAVIAIHPDAASVEYHMDVGASAFRGFADFIEMEAIEVYGGEPTERMLQQLREKAQALGENGRVVVDRLQSGFARLEVAETIQRGA